ncbi:hypothetical protein C8J57DRAFT_1060156, partial [Mycena rebaudengoi]
VWYNFIDFGLLVSFETRGLATGICGRQRKHIAEISATVPYDLSKVDVRLLGEMLANEFFLVYSGLEDLIPLVKLLRQDDSDKRPIAEEALLI